MSRELFLNIKFVFIFQGKDWKDDEAPEGSRGVIINMGTRSGTRKAVVINTRTLII
jgi:hypothetical protein